MSSVATDAPQLLILFDVDGTLLRGATKAHRQAIDGALREVHGVDPAALHISVSPAGSMVWLSAFPASVGSSARW